MSMSFPSLLNSKSNVRVLAKRIADEMQKFLES
jgi:hypothetical protein